MIHISKCVLGSTGHNSGETEDTATELWKLAVQEPSLTAGLGFLVVFFFPPRSELQNGPVEKEQGNSRYCQHRKTVGFQLSMYTELKDANVSESGQRD